MALAERATEILDGLPRDWKHARLEVRVEEPEDLGRAGLMLAPATPGRSADGYTLDVYNGPAPVGASSELVRRVLARLDREGIRGRLVLVGSDETASSTAPPPAETDASLAGAWDELLATFPPDWSHCYAEVVLDSSDYIERAALLMAPANPARGGELTALRFRVARTLGYGASVGMARRCLERLDAEGITGTLKVLRVVSDDHPAATQGPVWRIAGRSV
ncbi:MAG TPA: hypothetical protein VES61_03800 [Gaiellaceae bacterium]|nr:hypothetical protein [Gaiellaceae bacterium]